jgi:hypothetical protein
MVNTNEGELVLTSHSGNRSLGIYPGASHSSDRPDGETITTASSHLDLARDTNVHDIHALLQLSLTRHLASPHQFRALRHIWVLHH